MIDIHRVYGFFIRRFRPLRMQTMAEFFGMDESTSVLDVGGYWNNWSYLRFQPQLTILNLSPRPGGMPDNVRWVQGDGRELPFDDSAFDVVYSNSVIEHVGGGGDRMRMAKEMMRVGRGYYCQTPNFWFPIEPHLLTPFLHWLPDHIRVVAARRFSVWGSVGGAALREKADVFVKSIYLLDEKEMRGLFPDAQWMHEHVFGLKKSLVAVRQVS